MLQSILIALLVGFLILVTLALAALLIMFVWNELAAYFGFKGVTYWIASMILLALMIIGSAFSITVNKRN